MTHAPLGLCEPGFEGGFVALAGFAKEPADGLVDQVVRMVKEDVGDSESIVCLSVSDKSHGADDTDALLP